MSASAETSIQPLWAQSAWRVINLLAEDSAGLKNNWCVPPEAGRFLYVLGRSSRALNIVEVGTSIGFSTLHLALAVAENLAELGAGLEKEALEKQDASQQACVITIDASQERQAIARENFEKSGLSSLIQTETGAALDVLQQHQAQWKQKLDLAFIDARKDEYLAYANLLYPCLKPGGLLIADNTRSHREEMQPFIDALLVEDRQSGLGLCRWESCELDTPNGLIIARKRPGQTSGGARLA